MDSRDKGSVGESYAVTFLEKKGYKIIARNWSSKLGEVDIIASEKDTLVFVEVKSRHSAEYGIAAQAVDARKQKQVIKSALGYIKRQGIVDRDIRFDVVSITGGEVELIRNAFQSDGRYRY